MNKLTISFAFIFFYGKIFSQNNNINLYFKASKDTCALFFDHIEGHLNLEAPDSMAVITSAKAYYLEGRIGNRDWISIGLLEGFCGDLPFYLPDGKVSACLFEIFRDMDSSEISLYKDKVSMVELRYRLLGGLAPLTLFPSLKTETWDIHYSNIDTVYLTKATLDDIRAFLYLKRNVRIGSSFVWLDQDGFEQTEVAALNYVATNFPNSVLADITEWLYINYTFDTRMNFEGLSNSDEEELKALLENLKLKTKSKYLEKYIEQRLIGY
jgi:hypothetical protein